MPPDVTCVASALMPPPSPHHLGRTTRKHKQTPPPFIFRLSVLVFLTMPCVVLGFFNSAS